MNNGHLRSMRAASSGDDAAPASAPGASATTSIQTHEQSVALFGFVSTGAGKFKKKQVLVSPVGRLQIEMVRLPGQRFAGVVLGLNTNTTVFSPNCALDEVLLKCCNLTSGQVVFQLNHVPNGGAVANANYIIKARPLSPGSFLDIVVPGMMVGESIIGQADTTNGVNVTIYARKAER
jgi:hypothetical protein